ncbi:hypothetical protein FHU35_121220 [Saccharopolyspora dendranthemae]|uniref:Uncharacterized protein n=1 Tax=Saccharopolyspora dendranthemae TaxID=1181886 RepID=A0A561UA32_9PSEU|nr:hypothetical protein FHU35_121220 [Saccharopolyspora dendranthemae]
MRRVPLLQVWDSARTAAGSHTLSGEYAATPCIGIQKEWRTESRRRVRFRHPHRQAK